MTTGRINQVCKKKEKKRERKETQAQPQETEPRPSSLTPLFFPALSSLLKKEKRGSNKKKHTLKDQRMNMKPIHRDSQLCVRRSYLLIFLSQSKIEEKKRKQT